MTTREGNLLLDDNRRVISIVGGIKDYTIRIKYAVYQTKGETIRLIGKYNCRCVAKEVVEYMKTQHLVECFITRKVEEI